MKTMRRRGGPLSNHAASVSKRMNHLGSASATGSAAGVDPALLSTTDRELQVLHLLWEGLELSEVAAVLHLSTKHVKNLRGELGKRFHAHKTVLICRKALKYGILKL